MLCAIYRSNKRDQTYLYVEKKDDFTQVPEELMKSFGKPVFSMRLTWARARSLRPQILKKLNKS
jgi:uncharacterized protein YcgL (UPF0745 family)